eukprot:CAMPEP_0202690400 /NCGR_PEP_ID=MMETSP1385-20130828/5395_1 /ASSEMBLY_ACC=CAM_ASM_000861 /TAXON_ID=933848 /ORGANISM="Elphidium margaritaceum" /LENGTH=1070 /DNA_ID=CAMNT_0049345661 /DNA_START=29 /DNA_END=3241 /DNA_ORIENTATION=+
MPAVRGLEDYLRTLEIVEARPLHELQNTTIGIDVFQWLRSNNFICRESLHSALGGLPVTLEKQVHEQLNKFHEWRMTPLFVFNGLKYSQNARAPFSSSRSRKYAAKRKQAWKSMENNNVEKAMELFSQISGYVSVSAQDDLIRIFSRWNALIPEKNRSLQRGDAAASADLENHDQNAQNGEQAQPRPQGQESQENNVYRPISWFRAPYYAASQMAYLESQEEMLHAVCGGCDLLMFGGEKVILNIDFGTSSFEVVDLEKVLFALKVELNPYCFVDTCLLSGFDASRTFEPLTLSSAPPASLDSHHHHGYHSHQHNRRGKEPGGRGGGGGMRRNFSFSHSLDMVQRKGSGLRVIHEFLCTFNDAASSSSYNSNMSASTLASAVSTRSLRSVGAQSQRSMKSSKSAYTLSTYQRKHKVSTRAASGHIDKMLQHMLVAPNENVEDTINNNTSAAAAVGGVGGDEEDEKMENPKYREYLDLYRVVRKRVCNAKVLSFNGETKLYQPFRWMNEQIQKQKKEQLKTQQSEQELNAEEQREIERRQEVEAMRKRDGGGAAPAAAAAAGGDGIRNAEAMDSDANAEVVNDVDDDGDVGVDDGGNEHNIPCNVYRLLGVGILSTFLPSAILGGHLIDTTPLIDSRELEQAMNNVLPLRTRILCIFQHAFSTQRMVSLQRWFEPNRDKELKYDTTWTSQWVRNYRQCIRVLFDANVRGLWRERNISLVTPLKILLEANAKKDLLDIKDEDDEEDDKTAPIRMPALTTISEVLTAAYCGTLITLGLVRERGALSKVAHALAKINKFEFETILALEMLQKEDLSEKAFTLIDENGKEFQIDTFSSHHHPQQHGHGGHQQHHHHPQPHVNQQMIHRRRTLRLLTRCCSLLPMRPFIDGKREWTSKLSHSLAAFNHVTTVYHTNLRNSIESAICWFYCHIDNGVRPHQNVLISPAFLKELALSLKQLPPEPCSAMGVLIEQFVLRFADINWNTVKKLPDTQKYKMITVEFEQLQRQFPVFNKTQFAIQNCMQFFYQICTLVKELGDAQILRNAVVQQFENAYEYLRELGVWDAICFMEVNQHKM